MVRKRRGNKQYEARLIELLRWRFEKAKFKVEDHFKVGKLPLEIDLIVKHRSLKKMTVSSLPRLFEYFKRYNVMELKTKQDPLKRGDLLKLQAYTWLYMQKNKIYSVADITVTAIAHHLTSTVIRALPGLGYKPAGQGIFRCDSVFVSYLISIEDLPDELVPEELQIFSNPARRQRLFLSCFGKKEKKPIMETLADLYESEVLKLMALYDIKPKSMRKYVEAMGREKVIAALRKDELMAALSKKDLMAALSKKDLMAALSKKDLMAALSKKDMITALGGKQRLLKSLLSGLKPGERQKILAQINGNGASNRQSARSRVA